MRHIRIYEEFTDNELEDLEKDLYDIGHNTRWTFGKDFGFGLSPKFQTEITGEEFPSISQEFFNYLFYKGDIVPKGRAFGFKNPEDFGVDKDFDEGITPSVFGNRYGIHINSKNKNRTPSKAEMAYVFSKVIQKLGEIRK